MTEPTKTKAPKFTGTISLDSVGEEAPVTRTGADLAEYEKLLLSSWEKKQAGHQAPAIGVTLPTEAVHTAQTRFRAAAVKHKLGVTFATHDHTSSRGKQIGLQPGSVRLVVEAKPRKQMAPRTPKPAAEATPSKPAAPVAKSAGLPAVKR